jgi:hypothetical protein
VYDVDVDVDGGRPVDLTIQISNPKAPFYGILLVGKAPTGVPVDVLPGVTARRTHMVDSGRPDVAGVVTIVLTLATDVSAASLAEWLYGRLCSYRGSPVAPETITIEGQTIAFSTEEMARVVQDAITAQAGDH